MEHTASARDGGNRGNVQVAEDLADDLVWRIEEGMHR